MIRSPGKKGAWVLYKIKKNAIIEAEKWGGERKTMEKRNRRWLSILLGLCLAVQLLPLSAAAAEPPDEGEQLAAFVEYMNEKAAAIGMTGSKFNDPIGMYNFTTARDFLKLMVWSDRYRELMQVWGASEHTVEVSGEGARQQTVVSTIRGNEYLDPYYEILGCKDGELPDYEVRNLAVILQVPDSGDKLAVVVLCAYGRNTQPTGSRAVARQIADLALEKYQNPEAEHSGVKVCCQSAIACLIPEEGADPENLQILYEKDADLQIMTASIAKVLTAVCLLDIRRDLDATFTYSNFDTNIGGFYAHDFRPGDAVSFRDGLYALLLPSSNVTARALAREGGRIILEEGAPDPTQIPKPTPESLKEGAIGAMAVGACAAATMEKTNPEP